MIFAKADFRFTNGTTGTFERPDLETPVKRHFCSNCGTAIGSESLARPTSMIIKVGTMDDASASPRNSRSSHATYRPSIISRTDCYLRQAPAPQGLADEAQTGPGQTRIDSRSVSGPRTKIRHCQIVQTRTVDHAVMSARA